ncbi:TIGR02647 family protein [Parasalinivibrio latis]|uniref:TIGR02647 family protein n=1 Tax=Parasalinivibrio latis TaxID=2952610 RepID=UPI0030E56D61
MPFTPDLVDEMNMLVKFTRSSEMMSGIKVHSDAHPDMISATKRLFDKGLITATDGGYLTPVGMEALERAKEALSIISGRSE